MQVRASQLEPRDITTESSQLEPIIWNNYANICYTTYAPALANAHT